MRAGAPLKDAKLDTKKHTFTAGKYRCGSAAPPRGFAPRRPPLLKADQPTEAARNDRRTTVRDGQRLPDGLHRRPVFRSQRKRHVRSRGKLSKLRRGLRRVFLRGRAVQHLRDDIPRNLRKLSGRLRGMLHALQRRHLRPRGDMYKLRVGLRVMPHRLDLPRQLRTHLRKFHLYCRTVRVGGTDRRRVPRRHVRRGGRVRGRDVRRGGRLQ